MPNKNRTRTLAALTEMKSFGRIEIIYWIAGEKHPLTGRNAINVLTKALVDTIDEVEPLRLDLRSPVIERVDRIYRHVHRVVEQEFQERWRYKRFER